MDGSAVVAAGVAGVAAACQLPAGLDTSVAFAGLGLAVCAAAVARDRRRFQIVVAIWGQLARPFVAYLTLLPLLRQKGEMSHAQFGILCNTLVCTMSAQCIFENGELYALDLLNQFEKYHHRVARMHYIDEGVGDADAGERLLPGSYTVAAIDGSRFSIRPDEF
jgi:hypothetical protein